MARNTVKNVTIIGAGQAGFHTALSLRKRGFEGEIHLLGNEGLPAYQRPPLSKAFLKGQLDEARLYFRPDAFYSDNSIDLRKSSGVESIDTSEETVVCSDGHVFRFDRLVITAGARPIMPPVPGAGLKGVFPLRSAADSIAIKDQLHDGARIVVIGGGYVGLEVASSLRQLNCHVAVVERLPRLLSRVTGPVMSNFYLDLHRNNGVDVHLGTNVTHILGERQVSAIRLQTGEEIPADIVVVGIGVTPNQEIALASGISCNDGVLVDHENCRTSVPTVYAAGDCARRSFKNGESLRLESVQNALDQAERVAASILEQTVPSDEPPWFWSDQYDTKLQTAGLFHGHDEYCVRGSMDDRRFCVLYFKDRTLTAIDSISDPVSFMATKEVLKRGLRVTMEDCMTVSTLRELVGNKKNT